MVVAHVARLADAQILDPDDPMTIGAMVGPEAFTEVKYLMHAKQKMALDAIPRIAERFERSFGRSSGGLLRTYRTEDAATVLRAPDFDLARALVTRRSAAQLRAWTVRGDVGPYLDAFAMLGPLPSNDLTESFPHG